MKRNSLAGALPRMKPFGGFKQQRMSVRSAFNRTNPERFVTSSPTSRECQLIHNPKFLLFAQGTAVSPPKSPCASPAGEFQHLTEHNENLTRQAEQGEH
ncbi:hypothetical protein AMECASPLE_010594 [Ameca splendens]|uniref:Uncharacterized protein n=1 Tax=Ameca splendens TaxID=208324 RepID=A0ABV0XDL5_9TELE